MGTQSRSGFKWHSGALGARVDLSDKGALYETETRAPEPPLVSHPHIVFTAGVCGGRARIKNSRIPVSTIGEYVRGGESLDNLLVLYSHIEPAAIDDAIGYYLDHREEIDREIEASSLEAALAETGEILGADGVIRFPKKPE